MLCIALYANLCIIHKKSKIFFFFCHEPICIPLGLIKAPNDNE